MVLMHSCLPEQQIAKTFIQSGNGINLLVSPPDQVYKFNRKGELVSGFDELNDQQKDSALWFSSRYMQRLSDSLFLEVYVNSFLEELRQLGFNVFLANAPEAFNPAAAQSYNVTMAQVQLDEYLYPVEDEFEYYDSVFKKRVDINAIDFSGWFDLTKAGKENARTTTLYGTLTAYDEFEGRFFNDPFSGLVRYRYTVDTIEVKEIYQISELLGKRFAGYLFDFFLNQYIAKNLPPNLELTDYYRYIRKRNAIVPAYEDRFEILGTR
jgi:hypothetical protein